MQEDRPPAVLAFARLVSFCINRVGLSARRRRRRHQVGRHQIYDRRCGTGLFGVVVLMLATCPSFPLLPPCCAAVAAGCRPLRPWAAVAWSRAARRAAAGCAAASAASRLREVLACAGATSFWVAGPTGPISTTPSTSVRVRCPWGMYSLKPVRRGGMVSSGATLTLPQLRARKVVFIPLLIPQPDWDKYHFFSGLSHI